MHPTNGRMQNRAFTRQIFYRIREGTFVMSIRKHPFLTRVYPDSEHGWSTGIPWHTRASGQIPGFSITITGGPSVETSPTLNSLVLDERIRPGFEGESLRTRYCLIHQWLAIVSTETPSEESCFRELYTVIQMFPTTITIRPSMMSSGTKRAPHRAMTRSCWFVFCEHLGTYGVGSFCLNS